MEFYVAFNSLVLLITLIINLTLAIYILFDNSKNEANWAFAGTLFSVALWTLTILMFLRVPSPTLVLLFRRLTPIGSSLVAGFLLYFSAVFPQRDKPLPNHVRIMCLLPGITFALLSVFSPLMIKGFIMQDIKYLFVGQPIWGPAYKFFSIYFIVYYLAGILNLVRKFSKAGENEKLQLLYVLIGLISSGILGASLSLILPLLGLTDTFTLGPVFTLLLAFFVAYAIVRHGLLNIEDFLVRGTVVLAFGAAVVGTLLLMQAGARQHLFAFYVILANLTLGGVVLFRNIRSVAHKALAMVTVSVAGWIFSVTMVGQSADMHSIMLWRQLAYLSGSFLLVFLLLFAFHFPKLPARLNFLQKTALVFPTIFFPILIFGGFFLKPTASYLTQQFALTYYAFVIYVLMYLSTILYLLLRKYYAFSGLPKLQVKYFLIGLGGTALISVFSNLILPTFGIFAFNWVGPYSTIIFVGLLTYAIVKHRLMSIELVMQKGFVYTLASGLIVGVFVLVVYLSEQFFREVFGYSSVVLIVLAALAIAIAYQPLVSFLQQITSVLFIGRRYDYRKTLEDASHEISAAIRMEDLAGLIVKIFVLVIGVKEISFLVFDPVRKKFKSVSPPEIAGSEKYIKIEIDAANPAVAVLNIRKEVLVSYELEKELASLSTSVAKQSLRQLLQRALEEMAKLEVVVWVPIISKNELVGFVTMGEKQSGDVFTADDLALFAVLVSQIAVALDNARLYEQVLSMKNYNEDVLQSMTNGVLTSDLRGNIITFNRTAEQICGMEAATVIGKNCEEVFGAGGVISTLVAKALRGRGSLQVEANLSNPRAGFVPVAVSATLLKDRLERKTGVLLTLTDLSKVRELENKVRQSDKLAALGTMAAGMAHEIKNPLSSMKVLSQLMPLKFDDHEFRSKFQEIMPKEIARVDRIVENLLGFARASTPKFERVRLVAILEENLEYFSNQLNAAGIKVIRRFEDLPEVVADAAQISQVFSNFILNAIQAMQGGGALTVELKKGKIVDGELQEVEVVISDTGCGMTAEQLNKLFEPFFTTKFGGTGLGLTISHSIIDGHGGSINVKSKPGQGTSFTIVLPMVH